jgi:LacI family transcriptional regulator
MATIRDVARMANVSISTVSLAFSAPGRVSAETLERVQRAAAAAGYAANPVAQSLASGKSRLIGLVVADISNPFFGTVLKEVERCALAAGFLVIISDSGGDPAQERAILDHLSGQRVAGIVLSPCGDGEAYIHAFDALKMPVVMFDHKLAGLDCDFVGSDNRLASAMLTEHLLQLGHRRIGFIAGTRELFTTRERVQGFIDTMAASGVEVDRTLITDGQYDDERAYAAAMRLLTRPDRPTAIIGSSNVMAMATLQAIGDLGVPCPERISLAGIDDVPWIDVISPRLTRVVQDATELGRISATRLLERISGAITPKAAGEDFVLTPRFILGTSSAAPQR